MLNLVLCNAVHEKSIEQCAVERCAGRPYIWPFVRSDQHNTQRTILVSHLLLLRACTASYRKKNFKFSLVLKNVTTFKESNIAQFR
ncbi:hypothetical protein V1477_001552 [Vespula maculifrons]|uniref:Uncharacterized protein n=1 Tax=Vespula maculifrons TaxID=7453 RepID=A0ABD2D1E4_VESMC